MGLLPSQKYDFILESFCQYLIEHMTVVGYKNETTNDIWIKMFLKDCDKGEWEI